MRPTHMLTNYKTPIALLRSTYLGLDSSHTNPANLSECSPVFLPFAHLAMFKTSAPVSTGIEAAR